MVAAAQRHACVVQGQGGQGPSASGASVFRIGFGTLGVLVLVLAGLFGAAFDV